MSYEDAQHTKYVQKTDSRFRKISGFWTKKMYDSKGRPYPILKSGKMNRQGFENMQAFGPDTILLMVPNKQGGRSAMAPEYFLVAVCAYDGTVKRMSKDRAQGIVDEVNQEQPSQDVPSPSESLSSDEQQPILLSSDEAPASSKS